MLFHRPASHSSPATTSLQTLSKVVTSSGACVDLHAWRVGAASVVAASGTETRERSAQTPAGLGTALGVVATATLPA